VFRTTIIYSFPGHFKIKSTEEINKTIEEHQVSLSTFKASRFIKPFAKEVDKWERDISHVLEVTELWLTVQRQWLYLEVNFPSKMFPKKSKFFF
jgi:dynein heavy chain